MTLRTALRLGRVSNLPTVLSNVLAAIALAGGHPRLAIIACACAAMSLMYVAGMWLNDAFDRDIDRVERPERPIPAGEVSAGLVFDVGFVMLTTGVLVVLGIALATGAGYRPVVSAVALGTLIIFYDAYHKTNPLSPVIMGLCRACVYTTCGLLVRDNVCAELALGVGLVLAYLIGLTYVAKQENLDRASNLWPLAFLGAPFVLAWPTTSLAAAIYIAFIVWVLRAVLLVRARRIKPAVTGLIAGISLLDALQIANLGAERSGLALAAAAMFGLTLAFQRIVPGT